MKLESFRIKNSLGHVYTTLAFPAFPKISDFFWKTEELRLELIQELEAKPNSNVEPPPA